MITINQDSFNVYLKDISKIFESGVAVEVTYRPPFISLIENISKNTCEKLIALNETKHIECGSPDILILKNGVRLGYVEFKDIGKNLDEEQNSEQLKNYKKSLHNLLLSDYLEFRWFVDGELVKSVRVASVKNNKLNVDKSKLIELADLLANFLNKGVQEITNPEDLAFHMARIARGIRDTLILMKNGGRESEIVSDVRIDLSCIMPEFKDEDKYPEFVDMFAQTIVYSLFIARYNHNGVEIFSEKHAVNDIPNTSIFIKKLFESVMKIGMSNEPYYYLINDMIAVLSNTNINKIKEFFQHYTGNSSPFIYFYEIFLNEYDRETRFEKGVFITPQPIVSYIVKSVDQLLKTEFDIKDGIMNKQKRQYETKVNNTVTGVNNKRNKRKSIPKFKNPTHLEDIKLNCHKVLILDPACGTGTFLYEIISYIGKKFIEKKDFGIWSSYVHDDLIPRLYGFEILIAPYTISHFNLLMGLNKDKLVYNNESQKLNIYLTNTLDTSGVEKYPSAIHKFIEEELNNVKEMKRDYPIMVIVGNPPYNVSSTNKYDISNYKQIDGKKLDEKNVKPLQDDYVKFIRWAQERIENTGYGIIAFVTNHAYIDNITFRGMRKSLMDTFDEIFIFDLHGNSSKKEVCPDGSKDENVFNIKQGVAISIFVKKEIKSIYTTVKYSELFGTRDFKYNSLEHGSIDTTYFEIVKPEAPNYIFKPLSDNAAEFTSYFSLANDIFLERTVGTQTSNDNITIAFDQDKIKERIDDFVNLPDNEGRKQFDKPLNKSSTGWIYDKAKLDVNKTGADERNIVPFVYRPFDIRYTSDSRFEQKHMWETVKFFYIS
jgi:Type ISP C-terminal specificity domain/N-6 DNA Methylase